MKKYIVLIAACFSVASHGIAASTAESKQKPETAMLPASAYRTPLDEIIVESRTPYWRQPPPADLNKPKVDAPKPGDGQPGRLQWAPNYSRDERDDYAEPREQMNPKARTKVFEIRF